MQAKSVTDTLSDMKTETSVDTVTKANTLDDKDTGQHTKIVVHGLGYTEVVGDWEKLRNILLNVITEALINSHVRWLKKHWAT